MEWFFALPSEVQIFIVGTVLVLAVFAFRTTFPDVEQPATALNPADQAGINADFAVARRDESDTWGKPYARRVDEAKRNRGSIILKVVVGMFAVLILAVILGLGYSAFDSMGLIKSTPKTVGPNDTCVRNGQKLSEGTVIQDWDECNGKTIVPATVPPTTAPTQAAATQPAETQPTAATVNATNPDQYGSAVSIWKSDLTIGDTGSFWQPLSLSGIQYYRDNGLVITEQACGQTVLVAQIYDHLSKLTKVSNVSVVVNLPNMAGVNPTVTFGSDGRLNVTHPLGCIYTVVYYP